MTERVRIETWEDFEAVFAEVPESQREEAIAEALRGLQQMAKRIECGDEDVRMEVEVGPEGVRAQQR